VRINIERVCPVCLAPILDVVLAAVDIEETGYTAGGSPTPVVKTNKVWMQTDRFSCGYADTVDTANHHKHITVTPCGEATSVAIELRMALLRRGV
jgi:hypothetical protein